MPVTDTHPHYQEYENSWKRIDDVLSGRDAIIKGGVDYLPMLSGQIDNHAAYRAYQQRGVWYGATGRTLDALLGAIFRKDPSHTVSSRLDDRLENFDGRGNTVYTFAQKATRQVIAKGRYGILVDMPARPDLTDVKSLTPFFAGYSAASIRHWRTREVNSIPKLDQVILQEWVQRPGRDGFGFTMAPRYRVLELDEAGMYQIRVFTQLEEGGDGGFIEEPVIQPMPSGTRIDYIPFIFLNPGDLMPDVSKSPLIDLADVNLAMWRASADLENGRHYTAHAQPYIIGLSETAPREWKIGGDSVWQLPEGCSVGMLESSAQLGSLENGVVEKRELMAFLGARLLRDQKKAAETAEAQEIQQSGENATLSSISRTISDGFKKALQIAEEWVSSGKEAEFELNQDFFSREMDPTKLTALVSALQANAIPLDYFLYNLKEGELLPPDATVEDARELLDMDAARAAELAPDPVLTGLETPQQAAAVKAAATAVTNAKPAATAGTATQKARQATPPVAKPKARTT